MMQEYEWESREEWRRTNLCGRNKCDKKTNIYQVHTWKYIEYYIRSPYWSNLQGEKWAKQYKQKQVKALLH